MDEARHVLHIDWNGREGYAYGMEDYVEMSVQEGWAKAYDSWVIFMTLMAQSYFFPPPSSKSSDITTLLAGHLEEIKKLPLGELSLF